MGLIFDFQKLKNYNNTGMKLSASFRFDQSLRPTALNLLVFSFR